MSINPFNFKGCQFASFNYTNSYGEVNTYKVLLGASYENIVAKDLEVLQNAHFDNKDLEIARLSLVTKLLANLNTKTKSNQSKAQSKAYMSLGKGMRLHKSSGKIHIMCLLVSKHQTKAQSISTTINQNSGDFKSRPRINSSQTTLNQNKVKELLKLKMNKIKQFTFMESRLKSAKVNGQTISF